MNLIQLLRSITAARINPITVAAPSPRWLGQRTNPDKRGRREALRAIGRRQVLKRLKAARRAMMEKAQG